MRAAQSTQDRGSPRTRFLRGGTATNATGAASGSRALSNMLKKPFPGALRDASFGADPSTKSMIPR